MSVTEEQQELIDEFERHCIFEFVQKEDVHDHKSFVETWEANIQMLHDIIDEADRYITSYKNKYIDEIYD